MSQDSSSIVSAVDEAVDSAAFLAGDRAVIALAKRYAALLDEARANADEFAEIEIEDRSQAMYRRLERLETRVNVATVAAELGPKLLAALTALGLSPEARLKAAKGGPADSGPSRPASALAALRGEQDELAQRRKGSTA